MEASDEARQALARSESLYRALFEQANEAIFLEDDNLRIVDANPRACDLLGYGRDELLSARLEDILPAGAHPEPIHAIDRDLSLPFEGINIHRDGHEIPVEVTLSPVMGSDPRLVFAIVRDITDRKRTLAEIHQRARQLEALHAINLEMVRELDLDELIRSVSLRVANLLGAGLGGLYLYHPESDQLMWAATGAHPQGPNPPALVSGEGLVGKVWAQQRPIWIGRYNDWPGRMEGGRVGFESILGVPVRWGDQSFGVLSVYSTEAIRLAPRRPACSPCSPCRWRWPSTMPISLSGHGSNRICCPGP